MSSRGRRIRKPTRRHFPLGEQIIYYCFAAFPKEARNFLDALCFCWGIWKCYMNIRKYRVALELLCYKNSVVVRSWEFRRWLRHCFRSLGSLYRRQWLRGWGRNNKSTEEDDRGDGRCRATWGLPWRHLQSCKWWRGYWKGRPQHLRACGWSRLDQRRRQQTNGFRVYEQQVRVQALQLCDAQMWGEMFLSAGEFLHRQPDTFLSFLLHHSMLTLRSSVFFFINFRLYLTSRTF